MINIAALELFRKLLLHNTFELQESDEKHQLNEVHAHPRHNKNKKLSKGLQLS